MIKSPAPRYDRIISLVLVIIVGLTLVLFIDINPNILRIIVGGDLPVITLSWIIIAVLIIITSTGADLLARAHPEMQTRTLPILNLGFLKTEIAPGFWILPSFSIIGSFAFFRLFSNSLQGAAFVLALIAAGGLLLMVLVAQHYALDRNPEVQQRARLVLDIITYLLVFGVCSAVYFERFRTLYAASFIGASGALLAYAILRWNARKRVIALSGFVGLLLAEATWALNYWAAPFLLGGTLLMVMFYIIVSMLQHRIAGTLQRRMIIEYGLLGSGLLIVVIYATFYARL
jgi:hypothetical protein